MIELLRALVLFMRERRNRRIADLVGPGTRVPGVIDKRAPLSKVWIGAGCLIQGRLVVERNESVISIGENTLVGPDTVIDCALSITVERDVLISYGCNLSDSDNHSIYPEQRIGDLANWMNGRSHDWSTSKMAPIRICNGAWIGARSVILKGVTVGPGAVVGMGSVVTRDVPARTIVAGSPAKVIRTIPAVSSVDLP